MGQYHHLTCPDLNAAVTPSSMGAFSKAREQVGNLEIGGALTLLCASGFGAHPRDLPWANTGAWAGKPIFMVGDYAEDGDALGHPSFQGKRLSESQSYSVNGTGKATRRRKDKMTCVGESLFPVLERVLRLRLLHKDQRGKSIAKPSWPYTLGPITKDKGYWDFDLDAYKDAESRQYFERILMRMESPAAYQRPPMQMKNAPDTIPSIEEVGAGSQALWVSLDAREYIDLAALGARDLTQAIETGEGLDFVIGSLFHRVSRGGGDMIDDAGLGVVGRWRGDRLVLMGPGGVRVNGKTITPEMVRAQFADLTDTARIFTAIQDKWEEAPEIITPQEPENTQDYILYEDVIKALEAHVPPDKMIGKTIEAQVRPTTTFTFKKMKATVPASVTVLIEDSVLWMDADTRAKMATLAGDMRARQALAKFSKKGEPFSLSWGGTRIFQITFQSAHRRLELASLHAERMKAATQTSIHRGSQERDH